MMGHMDSEGNVISHTVTALFRYFKTFKMNFTGEMTWWKDLKGRQN